MDKKIKNKIWTIYSKLIDLNKVSNDLITTIPKLFTTNHYEQNKPNNMQFKKKGNNLKHATIQKN